MPTQDWVERTFHRKWYAGEAISVAIGQGMVTTTPLQLARLIGGIASGGVFMQPHMLKENPSSVPVERVPISESTIGKVTDAMYGVVNEPGGTGGHLKLAGIELSGKSGTAQVIGYDKMQLVRKGTEFADNAWFVGYAPKRNPEICVAVLVQESGQHGGEAAGPVVRDIVKAYYDKKARKTQGELTADNKAYDLKGGAAASPATQTQPVLKPASETSAVATTHAANVTPQR
jgi:penicillin-binding protein 2